MLPKTKHLKRISISISFRCFVFPRTCQFPLVWRHVLPLYFPDPKPVVSCYGEKNQTSPDILFSWNDIDAWWEELKLMSCYSPDGTANCHVSPFLNQMSNGPFRETANCGRIRRKYNRQRQPVLRINLANRYPNVLHICTFKAKNKRTKICYIAFNENNCLWCATY